MLKLGKEGHAPVEIPLETLNRHGLISGTTGSGKTRTMQRLVEEMHLQGINVFLSDVKGDCSGFFKQGEEELIRTRNDEAPRTFPITFWSISNAQVPLRFRLDKLPSELIARLLNLNETQESYVEVALLYAKEHRMALTTLDDLLIAVEKASQTKRGMQQSTLGVILRKIETLQAKGVGRLFGPNDLKVKDVTNGSIHVLNLSDVRDSEEILALANAFLLSYCFDALEEVGDGAKPKLCIFFDEAHYLFENSNKSLIRLMEKILRQIRSKGVGIFFVTHDPLDLPDIVLKMLGLKAVHALRAFTQDDVSHLKAIAKSFPKSGFVIEEEVKDLEKGTCFLTYLTATGQMSSVRKVHVYAPRSSMESFDMHELPRNETYARAYAPAKKQEQIASHAITSEAHGKEKTRTPKGNGIDLAAGAMAVLRILLNMVTFAGKALFETMVFFLKKPKRLAYLAMFILFVVVLVLALWFAYKGGWLS